MKRPAWPTLLAAVLALFLPLAAAADGRHLFIDNGVLRLGVDLESGGSIFHLSEVETGRNLLNHHDQGRFVQQSFYGNPDGSTWSGRPWTWNPVQGGDYRGKPTTLLDHSHSETALTTKSTPMHWATGEHITEAVMESAIALEDHAAHIRFRFEYNGETAHGPHHQEMPAVFVDYALPNLVIYEGDRPWTGGELTKLVPGWPNEYQVSSEEWFAFVDEDGWGIGVYTPGTPELTTYRHPGEPGPLGGGCSYAAPIRTLAVTPGLALEYDVYLTIGTVDEIRQRFAGIRAARKNRPETPEPPQD